MKAYFADSYYFFALANPRDESHAAAYDLANSEPFRIITTVWIITELADGFSMPANRMRFFNLYGTLTQDPLVEIIPPSQELFSAGLSLYSQRPDKAWSLTDCISFIVMERRGLSEALTGDHHFQQAGFTAVLDEI